MFSSPSHPSTIPYQGGLSPTELHAKQPEDFAESVEIQNRNNANLTNGTNGDWFGKFKS